MGSAVDWGCTWEAEVTTSIGGTNNPEKPWRSPGFKIRFSLSPTNGPVGHVSKKGDALSPTASNNEDEETGASIRDTPLLLLLLLLKKDT